MNEKIPLLIGWAAVAAIGIAQIVTSVRMPVLWREQVEINQNLLMRVTALESCGCQGARDTAMKTKTRHFPSVTSGECLEDTLVNGVYEWISIPAGSPFPKPPKTRALLCQLPSPQPGVVAQQYIPLTDDAGAVSK